MKQAYLYSTLEKEFLFGLDAEIDQLETQKQHKTIYLLPADATFVAPPEKVLGKAIVWTGSKWKYVDDNRYKIIYDKTNSLNTDQMPGGLYADVPDGYTLVVPPDLANKYVFNDETEKWEAYQPTIEEIIAPYDAAMEKYLRDTRVERGYTTREPSDYRYSEVPRWATDAEDWIKFRDAVMLYALAVENHAMETGEIPSMEEFLANMPKIHWTYNESENESESN